MENTRKDKVLIIEDNVQNMYLLAYLLINNNYVVKQAFSGSEGIEAAKDFLPDIILLDIQLPDMDGYAICRKLKEKGSSSVIIAVTSYAMGGDREKALEAGAAGYIEKPVDPDTFIDQMRKISGY